MIFQSLAMILTLFFDFEALCKRATSVEHLTNFCFEFFYEIFTEDASLLLPYHGAKNSNQGGPALNPSPEDLGAYKSRGT